MFVAMNEVQKSVVSRFGPRTRVSGIYDVPGLRECAACFAVCVYYIDLDSVREQVAGTDGSPQLWAGADELEFS